MQNRTLHVFARPIEIEVVEHIADVHIVEHCGGERVEYHWAMEVTMEGGFVSPAQCISHESDNDGDNE